MNDYKPENIKAFRNDKNVSLRALSLAFNEKVQEARGRDTKNNQAPQRRGLQPSSALP